MPTLGTKIKLLRLMEKYTQKEVADILGISQPTYNRLENDGQILLPQKLVLEKLCKLYKVTKEYLIEERAILDHYPENIQKFIKNPECSTYIEEAYIKWRYEQIQKNKG